jgi:2-polyprenyl-3-methyl-5-hydroxy-6-metoxy-1,4-benzoquinol methylase
MRLGLARDRVLGGSEGYFAHKRPEMLGYVPLGAARVLDIGCGEGAFGFQLKERGVKEVWGVEISACAAAKARDRLDVVVAGDIQERQRALPDGFFDCIVLNDVIEHLIDPSALLDGLRWKLTDRGVIVVSVPNVRFGPVLYDLLIRGQWRYTDSGVLDRTHLRFFTRDSVRRMSEDLGYEVECLEGINALPSGRMKWLLHLLTALSFGFLRDLRFQQFAGRLRPGNRSRHENTHLIDA